MDTWGRQNWRHGRQLFCFSHSRGDYVELEVNLPEAGVYQLAIYFTNARDYGIVEVSVDGRKIDKPFDGFHGKVIPSGKVEFGNLELSKGSHHFRFTAVGKSEKSTGYRIGIDCLTFRPVK
jgi:hypothetical protein